MTGQLQLTNLSLDWQPSGPAFQPSAARGREFNSQPRQVYFEGSGRHEQSSSMLWVRVIKVVKINSEPPTTPSLVAFVLLYVELHNLCFF